MPKSTMRRPTMTTMTKPTTRTLDAPGAVLTYDVRSNPDSAAPVLFMIGSPMGAGGFNTLAGHFADRTLVTNDPRCVRRIEKPHPPSPPTPQQQAHAVPRLMLD